MHIRNREGFTLIEVLIVILIIALLGAIAIPALLGQRQKARARALEVSAKGMEKELAVLVGDYNRNFPLILSDSNSTLGCYERLGTDRNASCSTIYPDMPKHGEYSSMSDLITNYVRHQNEGLLAISPYDKAPLLTTDSSPLTRAGHVLITNSNDSTLEISSWAGSDNFLTNTSISSR